MIWFENLTPYIIQWIGLLLSIVFYVMGFAFDKRYSLSLVTRIYKGREFWEYIAHSAGEAGIVLSYSFFCLMNPTWTFLPYWGVILGCAGLFLMGFVQSKDKPDRDWRWIGNGKGNNVEYFFRFLTWLLNVPQIIYFKVKKTEGELFFTMSNVSAPVRIGCIVWAVCKLIW